MAERDDDTAFAVLTATEVDFTNTASLWSETLRIIGSWGTSKCYRCIWWTVSFQRNVDFVAIWLNLVWDDFSQVKDDTGTILSSNGGNRLGDTDANGLRTFRQLADSVLEVEGDTRGVVDREA